MLIRTLLTSLGKRKARFPKIGTRHWITNWKGKLNEDWSFPPKSFYLVIPKPFPVFFLSESARFMLIISEHPLGQGEWPNGTSVSTEDGQEWWKDSKGRIRAPKTQIPVQMIIPALQTSENVKNRYVCKMPGSQWTLIYQYRCHCQVDIRPIYHSAFQHITKKGALFLFWGTPRQLFQELRYKVILENTLWWRIISLNPGHRRGCLYSTDNFCYHFRSGKKEICIF